MMAGSWFWSPEATIGMAMPRIGGSPRAMGMMARKMSPTTSAARPRVAGSKQKILRKPAPGCSPATSFETQHENASRRSASFSRASVATEIPRRASAPMSEPGVGR